jgi:hypothetical protein
MKFNKIFEHALDNTSLKRVRMKTDPKDSRSPGLSSPYEGYIIEEHEDMIRVLMMTPEPEQAMDVSPCDVEPSSTGQTFEDFKQFVLKYIHDMKRCDYAEATHHKILHAADIQHLESFLKEQGVERSEFEKLCRLFLMS